MLISMLQESEKHAYQHEHAYQHAYDVREACLSDIVSMLISMLTMSEKHSDKHEHADTHVHVRSIVREACSRTRQHAYRTMLTHVLGLCSHVHEPMNSHAYESENYPKEPMNSDYAYESENMLITCFSSLLSMLTHVLGLVSMLISMLLDVLGLLSMLLDVLENYAYRTCLRMFSRTCLRMFSRTYLSACLLMFSEGPL